MRKVFAWIGLGLLVLMSAASATASPSGQTTTTWTGDYYSNPDLQGDPAFSRQDPVIDFAWGKGSPGGNVPADGFSVRWERWMLIDTPGTWTFTTVADNGVRLFIDDQLVIDAWNDQPTGARTVLQSLTQSFHLVRLEYYHRTGDAQAHLFTRSSDFPDWRGEYYRNPDLIGAPAFVRNDSAINFDFGAAGPGGGIPGTNFSARWTGSPFFTAGNYRFTTKTDDGVRLWIDGQLLIDQWHDASPTGYSGNLALSTGNHYIKMEYYQHGGGALGVLTWAPIQDTETWHGEYFDNPGLQGTAVFARDDSTLNFDWGSAPPGSGIAQGINWSARWTARKNTPNAGYYSVTATADDGVRVWVDGTLLIDEWHDASSQLHAAMKFLAAGQHDWRVEFYQHVGTASLHLDLVPGAAGPFLASTNAVTGDVTIDTQNPNFFKAGSGWGSVANGTGGNAFSAPNTVFAQADDNWARWYAPLVRAGNYQVLVYIPAGIGTTTNARYEIAHSDMHDFQALNQSLYSKQWVSLGTFYFDASGDQYVGLSNVTYEPSRSTVVAADAVRFAAR
jgi:hypothetical protein